MKIDGEFLFNLRFADDIFLCTETPQELQQMLQHPYKLEQCTGRKCPRLHVLGTTLQHQGNEPGQRDTKKNHGRLGGIRQTPGCLQRQPYHLPEAGS